MFYKSHIFVVGNVNADLIMGHMDIWPTFGTEIVLDSYQLRVGGAAGNVALALHALESKYTVLANRGNDMIGKWLLADLNHLNAKWRVAPTSTSVSVGLSHPDGERTFFTHTGHLRDYDLDFILEGLSQAVKGDVLMLLGGFLCTTLRKDYVSLLEFAKQREMTIALDPGWPPEGWTADCRREVSGWLGWCDHLLINEIETLGLAQTNNFVHATHMVRSVLPTNSTLVVKCGKDGARAWQQNQDIMVAAPHVNVVDTIGAGDSFNAGYLDALAEWRDLEACVRMGVQTASYAVSTHPRRYASRQEQDLV